MLYKENNKHSSRITLVLNKKLVTEPISVLEQYSHTRYNVPLKKKKCGKLGYLGTTISTNNIKTTTRPFYENKSKIEQKHYRNYPPVNTVVSRLSQHQFVKFKQSYVENSDDDENLFGV